MQRLKQLATVGGTFAVALGIGFVMQNEDALAARMNGDTIRPQIDLLGAAAVLPMPNITPTISIRPAMPEDSLELRSTRMIIVPSFVTGGEPVQLGSPESLIAPLGETLPTHDATVAPNQILFSDEPAQSSPMMPQSEQDVSLPTFADGEPVFESPVFLQAALAADDLNGLDETALADTCTVSMEASLVPEAMVQLSLVAPCLIGERVTFYHEGLLFSELTSVDGIVEVDVPALATHSVFIATFGGGEGAVAEVNVPNLADYHRAVVQWEGEGAFELHALEAGALYGAEGHVWVGASDGSSRVIALGDQTMENPFLAEVYTAERALSAVTLTVEAQISAANCGSPVSAQALQLGEDGTVTARAVEMVMPDCDATGDYLVLHNMLDHLTLASR